jgi:hypothetical protein
MDHENALQGIITRCWEDEAFKERLLADPAAVLAAAGVRLPEGVTVNVVIDTETERTLVIPEPPGKLGDRELEYLGVSAGDCPTDGTGLTCQQVRVPD